MSGSQFSCINHTFISFLMGSKYSAQHLDNGYTKAHAYLDTRGLITVTNQCQIAQQWLQLLRKIPASRNTRSLEDKAQEYHSTSNFRPSSVNHSHSTCSYVDKQMLILFPLMFPSINFQTASPMCCLEAYSLSSKQKGVDDASVFWQGGYWGVTPGSVTE